MFATLFACAFVTAYVAAELPSYIHVCGRKDPNYDQCITDNINNLRSKICTSGVPEFNIPPIEPIIIDKIVIYDLYNLKLFLRNTKISNFCDFVINSIHTDLNRLHYDFDVTFKHLDVYTMYGFDIRLLVPLTHKGLAGITSDNLGGKISLDLKVVTKNGKKHIYASKVNTNLDVKSFNYKFDDSEKDLVQLHEILNSTIKSNEKDIVDRIKSAMEETFSKMVILISNNITRSGYEQLFPEEA